MIESLKLIIRPLQEEDLPALEWGGVYRRYRRLYRYAWREAKQGRRVILVAQMGAEIIGQIFIQLAGHPSDPELHTHTGYFYSFRVKPDFRNQGVGTQLIQAAEQQLHDLGLTRAIIAVARENIQAQQLYERMGFSYLCDDPGQWTYIDDQGQRQVVDEPAYLLHKHL